MKLLCGQFLLSTLGHAFYFVGESHVLICAVISLLFLKCNWYSLTKGSDFLGKEYKAVNTLLGFPRGTVVKNPPVNAGDCRLDP